MHLLKAVACILLLNLLASTAVHAQEPGCIFDEAGDDAGPPFVTRDDGFIGLSGLDFDFHALKFHSGFESDLFKTGYGARIGGFVPFGPLYEVPPDGTLVTGLDARFSYTHFDPRPNVVMNLPGVGDFLVDSTDLYLVRPGVGGWWYRPVTDNTLLGVGLVGGLMFGQMQSRINQGTSAQVDRLIITDVPVSRAFIWGGDVEIGLRLVNAEKGWGLSAHGSYGGYATEAITGYSHGGGFFAAGIGVTLYPEVILQNWNGSR